MSTATITGSAIDGSPCVECKNLANHVALSDKPKQPMPGDKTLCLGCGSLNILDDKLMFRAPTVDEFLDVAKDPNAQRIRRQILRLNALAGKEKRA